MNLPRFTQAALMSAVFAGIVHGQTLANLTGGRLSLTTTGQSQNLKIEAVSGVVRVFGFAGIPDGTSYPAPTGVSLSTGAGNDSVEVEVSSAQSFDVRLDTGEGNSETKLKWRILGSASMPAATFTRAGATTGTQIVALEVENESSRAALSVDAGTASDVVTKLTSSNSSEYLRVGFTGNAPKLMFELNSAAAALDLDIRGGGTAGNDELVYKVAQSRPAQLQVNWALDALGGSDKVEAFVSAAGSTVTQRGNVFGRAGDDSILFETDAFATISGLTLNGGSGADRLSHIVKGRYQASQTLRPVLLGGDGDDELVLTTDTGIFGTGLPNDVFPLIDCGLGNDLFNAFGVIRACEARL
jgi:hypothetical protein